MRILRLTIVLCLASGACFGDNLIQRTANEYFETYSSRLDFDKFMLFYAKDAVLKDIVYGVEMQGTEEIRKFFDWERGNFSTVNAGPILVITDQVFSNNRVVTTGYFEEFYFGANKLGPWEFVIWQWYEKSGKIREQHDWINYSPKKIMIGDNNAK
jgi:hypothetical protein